MDDQLVGYLLHALDEESQREVERYLETHPEGQERLEVLRQALEPLAADAREIPVPVDLAERTLARIAEQTRDLPVATTLSFPSGGKPFWRRADALVAACLLVTILGLGLPALYHWRIRHDLAQCQNNLLLFFKGLQAYHTQHRSFPDVAGEKPPRQVAGMISPILIQAEVLPQDASVRCPANGPGHTCPFTLEQLRVMAPEQFKQHAPSLTPCYAYSLGYFDRSGYQCPKQCPNQPNSQLPLMADALPPHAGGGNSPNHGGQNVLFHDGSVRFHTLRHVGLDGDDIYLNKAHKVAAGLDCRDTVLGHSAARPRGEE